MKAVQIYPPSTKNRSFNITDEFRVSDEHDTFIELKALSLPSDLEFVVEVGYQLDSCEGMVWYPYPSECCIKQTYRVSNALERNIIVMAGTYRAVLVKKDGSAITVSDAQGVMLIACSYSDPSGAVRTYIKCCAEV